MDEFSLGERVTNLEDTIIGQTHNVARIHIIDDFLFLRHEGCGSGETNLLVTADMQVVLVAVEHA